MYCKIFLFACVVGINFNVILGLQKLTLFSQTGQKGRGLIFTGREPNVWKLRAVIPLVQSYCVEGIWGIYDSPHYKKDFIRFVSPNQESCGNLSISWKSISSLRPLGPETQGIAFYKGESFVGPDAILNADAADPAGLKILPFEPKSMILTENSSWTLYEKENFEGKNFCLKPKQHKTQIYSYLDYAKIGISTIRSILPGC